MHRNGFLIKARKKWIKAEGIPQLHFAHLYKDKKER